VAPNGQFEVASSLRRKSIGLPITTNVLMDVMEKERAEKHDFERFLLHEKPFAGVNGSGKTQ